MLVSFSADSSVQSSGFVASYSSSVFTLGSGDVRVRLEASEVTDVAAVSKDSFGVDVKMVQIVVPVVVLVGLALAAWQLWRQLRPAKVSEFVAERNRFEFLDRISREEASAAGVAERNRFEFLDRISCEEASAAELRSSVPGRPLLHSLFAVADASTGTPTPEKPPRTAATPIGAGGASPPTAETLTTQETLYGIAGTSTMGCSSPTLETLEALHVVADQWQSRDFTWV
jgi:hypothetical protein